MFQTTNQDHQFSDEINRNDGESYFSPTEFPPQMTGLAAPSIEPLLKHHEHHLH